MSALSSNRPQQTQTRRPYRFPRRLNQSGCSQPVVGPILERRFTLDKNLHSFIFEITARVVCQPPSNLSADDAESLT